MAMSMRSPLALLSIADRFTVLNPKEKMGYFKKHWPADLHDNILKCAEEEV